MNYRDLEMKIRARVFTIQTVRDLFPEHSTHVINQQMYRLVKSGEIHRIRRGIYAFPRRLIMYDSLSALLYSPSYISLETVLTEHGVLFAPDKQDYAQTIFLVTTHRSNNVELTDYNYICSRIKPQFFFGYKEEFCEDNHIKYYKATLEKAVVDFLYLRRQTDPSCIDLSFAPGFDVSIFYDHIQRYPDWMKARAQEVL